MNNKIGVFDSGIGGLTTLKEIRKLLPNEDYIYFADSVNNPYGEKTTEELFDITKNIVDFLIQEKVKLIVIACNTATTKCVNLLRDAYPNMLFVGTEPAIKVACDSNSKNILVLATPVTINSERTKELINNFKRENQNITLIKCDKLANAIETNDNKLIDKLLHEYLDEYKDKKIDTIVLGCTHYPLIKKNIKKILPKVTLVDGNKGVARRVKYLLERNKLLNPKTKKGKVTFIQTKKEIQ